MPKEKSVGVRTAKLNGSKKAKKKQLGGQMEKRKRISVETNKLGSFRNICRKGNFGNSNWLKFVEMENSKHGSSKGDKENEKLPLMRKNCENKIVKLKQGQHGKLTKLIGMDCEMVGIGENGSVSVLARVSLVNSYGHCIYDKYVKPTETVTDFRTFVSGIRPHHLKSGEDFFKVQKEVADILKGRTLVGHAVKHDLQVLVLNHPRKFIRDTTMFIKFRKEAKGTLSLKNLSYEFLNVKIQDGEHDSVEDARAAMQLYMTYRKEWEKERRDKWLSQKQKPVTSKVDVTIEQV